MPKKEVLTLKFFYNNEEYDGPHYQIQQGREPNDEYLRGRSGHNIDEN